MEYPKTIPYRSPAYRKFIAGHRCLACGSSVNVEASHNTLGEGSKASKPSDFKAVPACGACHKEQHNKGYLTFWARVIRVQSCESDRPDHTKELVNGWLARQCLEYVNEYFTQKS